MFLKKFKIIEDDSEIIKILLLIMWIDKISDFVFVKVDKRLIFVFSKDRGRFFYFKVCEK